MTRPGEEITLVSEDGSATALSETCQDLLSKSQFLDVTLSCIDGQVQAHRVQPIMNSNIIFRTKLPNDLNYEV